MCCVFSVAGKSLLDIRLWGSAYFVTERTQDGKVVPYDVLRVFPELLHETL